MRLATETFDFFPLSTASTGTVNEDAATPRSGASAGSFPSGAFNIVEALPVATPGRAFFYRFAVKIDKLPSVTTAPLRLLDSTGTVLEVSITTAGLLRLFNPIASSLLTGNETIVPGVWNVVEIKLLIPVSGSGKASWRFNGVSKVVDQEMNFRNIGISRARFGNPGGVTSGAVTFIDDMAINDDQGAKDNTWVGTEPDPLPTQNQRYWGADIAETETDPHPTQPAPFNETIWDEFEAATTRKVGIVHYSDPWGEDGPIWDGWDVGPDATERVHARGAIGMKSLGGPSEVIQRVNDGEFDNAIRTWAREARAFGHPIFLRLWWEMNGTWFSWGRSHCTGEEYVEAWRRFHDIVSAFAPNVTFVWCPNALFEGHTDPFGDEEKEASSFYPGDEYVDWTGTDGYTGQNPALPLGWRTSKSVFLETYERFMEETPDKPVMICEVACSEYFTKEEPGPPHKAEWIRQLLGWTVPFEMPNVRALCWFNWNIEHEKGRVDWPIQSSPSAEAEFAERIHDPYYVDPEVGRFALNAKVPLPGETSEATATAASVGGGLSTPHFSLPFRVAEGAPVEVEQDSVEEIGDCVEASLRTPVGSRIDAPDFGRPDEVFSQLGPGTNAESYLTAIERDEPRARELGEAEVDGLVKRVRIHPQPRSK